MRKYFDQIVFEKPFTQTLSLYEAVLRDSSKCLAYPLINRHIACTSQLKEGDEILAFIKNYRHDVIFCSLNIGVSGVIRDVPSRKLLEKQNSFGDCVYVTFHGFEKFKG